MAIWRYNSLLEQYDVLDGSMTTLELQPESEVIAAIYCKQWFLAATNIVRVRQGDIVGVGLSTSPIPLIGRNSEHSIMTTSSSQPANVPSGNLVSQQLSLHLFADISGIIIIDRKVSHTFQHKQIGPKFRSHSI